MREILQTEEEELRYRDHRVEGGDEQGQSTRVNI